MMKVPRNKNDYIGYFENLDLEEMKDNQDSLLYGLDQLSTAISALKEAEYVESTINDLEAILAELDIHAEQTVEIIEEEEVKAIKEYEEEMRQMNYEFERSRI